LGVRDQYDSQALHEVLLIALKRGLIPNTLCFTLSERFLYLGKDCKIGNANLEYCRKEGIPIVRSPLGSSVAVFDEGCLMHTIVSRSNAIIDTSLDFELLTSCIVKGLNTMGLKTEQRPNSNDIVINHRKISGSSLNVVNDLIAFDGTIFVDFDYDFCENALMPLPEKFVDKKAKSHREWITTVRAELGKQVTFSEVVSALRKGFEAVLQVEFEISTSLTEAEEQILKSLREKYHSEEWIKTGRWSPVKDYWRL